MQQLSAVQQELSAPGVVSTAFWSIGLTVMLRPHRLQRDWAVLHFGHSVIAVLGVEALQLEHEPDLALAGNGIFWQKLQVILLTSELSILRQLDHPGLGFRHGALIREEFSADRLQTATIRRLLREET